MLRLNSVRCAFAVLPLLLWTLPAPAEAAPLKLDITYTNGQILSGPLSADLTELPTSVLASFTLTGPTAGDYDLDDVLQASLAFGDGAWGVGDLQSFATTVESIPRRHPGCHLALLRFRPHRNAGRVRQARIEFPSGHSGHRPGQWPGVSLSVRLVDRDRDGCA